MKKFFALALAVVLCMSLSLSVFASDYVVGEDGNATMEDAYGYAISIDDINGTIGGEDATILTDGSLIGNIGLWSRYFIAEKSSDNVYVVATAVTCPAGTAPATPDLSGGKILVAVHSASSNPADDATYGNWHDYIATAAIKVGDIITLSGIDLAAGTCTNGTITVSAPSTDDDSTDSSEESKETVIVSKNVAAGKTYALSGCGEYAGYKTNLTDGVMKNDLAGDDNATQWFAFYNNGTDASKINAPNGVGYAIFDLGEATDLNQVKAHLVYNAGWGIKAPAAVKAYVSDDNENWTEIGTLEGSASAEGTAYWVSLNTEATGRYVKVEFTLAGTFAFVNEIEVYGDVEVEAGEEDNSSTSTPTPSTPVKPGDASNTIVFAILALVAIAGSAVVIKTRK